jgi:hypothetical protein
MANPPNATNSSALGSRAPGVVDTGELDELRAGVGRVLQGELDEVDAVANIGVHGGESRHLRPARCAPRGEEVDGQRPPVQEIGERDGRAVGQLEAARREIAAALGHAPGLPARRPVGVNPRSIAPAPTGGGHDGKGDRQREPTEGA